MEPVARIEVDLFSGRPNPALEVHGREAAKLAEMLARDRQRLTKDAAVPPGVGFRGFLVRLGAGPVYRISGDVLTRGDDRFADPQCEVHAFIETLLPLPLKALVGSGKRN